MLEQNCACDTVYLCIGTKNLLKYEETNISQDHIYLNCTSCKKYREFHSQNYIMCDYCDKCYCKGCDKDLVKHIYEMIRNRNKYLLNLKKLNLLRLC